MTNAKRILIVEDEKAILDVYRDILSPKGQTPTIKSSRTNSSTTTHDSSEGDAFDLTLVQTGEEAIAEVKKSLIDKKPFALGFFDVLLGTGIDGIEAVKQIHKLDSDMYAVL